MTKNLEWYKKTFCESNMARYDALPAEYREVLCNAPTSLEFKLPPVAERAPPEDYEWVVWDDWKKNTRKVYGPDHPQASENWGRIKRRRLY